MEIKIGYKRTNGETAGFAITFDDDGSVRIFNPANNTSYTLPFWLYEYQKDSVVFLGVCDDDSQITSNYSGDKENFDEYAN